MGLVTDAMLNNTLLNLHTAYLAKILSVNDYTAKIQPLGYTKAYGEQAKKQSPLTNVPILKNAKYKIVGEKLIEGEKVAVIEPLKSGDIVLCVCCERDITEAKKGKNALPSLGHHNMSDTLIIGAL